MNSLQILRELGKRAIFALMIISSLAFAVAAQKVEAVGDEYRIELIERRIAAAMRQPYDIEEREVARR